MQRLPSPRLRRLVKNPRRASPLSARKPRMAKRRNKRRWRVGNFVVCLRDVPTLGEEEWQLDESQVRSKVKKGEIGTVPCYEVSSLDGAWMTRLMPGSQMESMVSASLEEGSAEEWLELVLTNLMQVSMIPNGYYHQGILLLTAAYYRPELISGGMFNAERRHFLKDARKLRESFLSWWRDAEEKRETLYEENDGHDLRALEAQKILGEQE